MARHGDERALHSLPVMPLTQASINNHNNSSESGASSPVTSPLSPTDSSRIPRPSPTALRRSSSLRLRGERSSYLHSQNLHRSQQHHDLFPVITENGTPTRCSSSLSLTPSRGRTTRPRASPSSTSLSHHQHGACSEDCSDVESVKSFGSNYSTASACDHASFALNGTTWSGRSRRYVVHCSTHTADNDEYLTPTQRAAKQVRKFQALLREARKEIEEKEREIFRLTKEVVELRLYKASLNSPDEKTDSSEAATVRENNPFSPESPCKELPAESSFVESTLTSPRTPEKKESSLVDSGHFEDGSVHSKESVGAVAIESANLINESCISTASSSLLATPHDESHNLLELSETDHAEERLESSFQDEERKRIVDHYENRIEEMHRRHVDEIQLLKQNHNDKVESLLNQLSEVSTRYCETRPSLNAAETRTKELETEVEALRSELAEQKAMLADQEERNKQMYLKMYSKGQEAARIEHADQVVVLEQAQKNPTKVSVAELLQQLTVTQAELENVKVMYRRILESRNSQGALDPEITLQFLKSAIYYFLTDKENLHGHLNAIESILGFTDSEKLNIDRIYRSARK
ncbi:uncharacterized protein LOC100123315 isoform X3 [Nasonia vitripennis]|uniref:GRIP domain-containing protein n=1 Tax=Nasonia vitripennis TaxID=7425 RepID=A0A7M7T723_NASVI|nr:uncharacterized protein LOC100123315 isoform X3 [Nasonia vitripennis]